MMLSALEFFEGNMTNDMESIKTIIDRISNTLTSKGGEYRESVISVLPRGDWLSQIVIKANRAQRASSDEKLKDELLDTACYCILLLDKLEHETPKKTSSLSMSDIVYTDDDNTHHTGKSHSMLNDIPLGDNYTDHKVKRS